MIFRAEEYYRASQERIQQARQLHKAGESFALSMYCSGLAVECLLRAFRWINDQSFDGRHDLMELLRASQLLKFNEASLRHHGTDEEEIDHSYRNLRGMVQEVVELWNNNLRFASEDSATTYIKRIGRSQGHQGTLLKRNANDLLEASLFIVNRGVSLWKFAKRLKQP